MIMARVGRCVQKGERRGARPLASYARCSILGKRRALRPMLDDRRALGSFNKSTSGSVKDVPGHFVIHLSGLDRKELRVGPPPGMVLRIYKRGGQRNRVRTPRIVHLRLRGQKERDWGSMARKRRRGRDDGSGCGSGGFATGGEY